MELNKELREPIMIFYLVLRALDTIEDDMTLPNAVKLPMLESFYKNLKKTGWTFNGNGPDEKDRIVLTNFDQILIEYHKLRPEYQDIIMDICKKMGAGMAKYAKDQDFNLNGVKTVEDYDMYCHYVAGLVGEGLSKSIIAAKFGDPCIGKDLKMSNSMGLFLQKTNIIRDYKEDMKDGRSFWPQEIWSKYADKLGDFQKPENVKKGVYCISDLVLNALGEVKDVLTYLSLVSDHSTFNFCSIPQVMAIATLAEVFENPLVLKQNVKIRKGTTCQLVLEARTYQGVLNIFSRYLRVIHHKCPVADPSYLEISLKCGELEQFLEELNPDPSHIPKGAHAMKTKYYLDAQRKMEDDEPLVQALEKENSACNAACTFIGITLISLAYVLYMLYSKSD